MKSSGYPILLLFALLLTGCANRIAPTGGPKDETPPQVVEAESTPNLQTNFRPRSIELTFNEWVKLQNANQQIIISPPIQGYTTRLKGKTVILDLGDRDTLRSNVTYVVQFGESVRDLTENNPAQDLKFIFSTGPFIDSLTLSGKVVDAYTGEPVEKALVLLYDNLQDTAFQKERPLYFGRTDKSGAYKLSYLREGSYQLYALMDENANYRYDQANEAIAFLPEPIRIGTDTAAAAVPPLRLGVAAQSLLINSYDIKQPGEVKVVFNQNPRGRWKVNTPDSIWNAVQNDTLWLWHRSGSDLQLLLQRDTIALLDTFNVPPAPLGQATAPPLKGNMSIAGTRLHPEQSLTLRFNRPVINLDTAKISLQRDSLPERLPITWQTDSLDARKLFLRHTWAEAANYRFTLLPGAATDVWGNTNADTLQGNVAIDERKRFGNVLFSMTNADTSQQYIAILREKGKQPAYTAILYGQSNYNVSWPALAPGNYQLELVLDNNANGRWDAASYPPRQAPEPLLIRPLEALRPNWDVDFSLDLEAVSEF